MKSVLIRPPIPSRCVTPRVAAKALRAERCARGGWEKRAVRISGDSQRIELRRFSNGGSLPPTLFSEVGRESKQGERPCLPGPALLLLRHFETTALSTKRRCDDWFDGKSKRASIFSFRAERPAKARR